MINETTLKVNENISTTTSIGNGNKKTSTEVGKTPLPNEIIPIEKQRKEIKKLD